MPQNKEAKLEAQRIRRLKSRTSSLVEGNEAPIRVEAPIEAPVTYTGLARLISTPQGKKKLDQILGAFNDSSHPEYMQDVRLGIFGPTLWAISKL